MSTETVSRKFHHRVVEVSIHRTGKLSNMRWDQKITKGEAQNWLQLIIIEIASRYLTTHSSEIWLHPLIVEEL